MIAATGTPYTYNAQGLSLSKTVDGKTNNFTLVNDSVWSDGTYNYVWARKSYPLIGAGIGGAIGTLGGGAFVYFATSSATASTTMVVVDTNLKIAGPSVTKY